jgi:hypothetical protein
LKPNAARVIELILSVTSLSEKQMKSLLLSAAVMTVILSACGRETAPPAQPPAKSSSQAAPGAPASEMTKEDKEKAMEEAKAAAKSASKGAY